MHSISLQGGRRRHKKNAVFFVVLLSLFFTGCTGKVSSVPMLMPASDELELFSNIQYQNQAAVISLTPDFFASSYPVPSEQDLAASQSLADVKMPNAAILLCLTDASVLYAKNCYEEIYPASTTKLLTALTALKHGNLSDIVTVREDNGGVTTYGARLCGFQKGDQMTLEVLLNSMLVYSGNDAAIAIAEHISGDTETFVSLMNQEAAAIGATHTHFVNPHGLHHADHKTTAYDMYLILQECLTYEEFLPMVHQESYTAQYQSADGTSREKVFDSTNQYLLGVSEVPEGVTVYGGKTGSTGAAGDCLVLYSTYQGKEYISAVFGASSRTELYAAMSSLLSMELSDNIQN